MELIAVKKNSETIATLPFKVISVFVSVAVVIVSDDFTPASIRFDFAIIIVYCILYQGIPVVSKSCCRELFTWG